MSRLSACCATYSRAAARVKCSFLGDRHKRAQQAEIQLPWHQRASPGHPDDD
jgi:hypothetical protein